VINIIKTDYGFSMEFIGNINRSDVEDWLSRCMDEFEDVHNKFAMMIDFRRCDYMAASAKKTLDSARRVFYHQGMRRSIMIFRDANMARGFQKAAKQLGFDRFERYMAASAPDVNQKALGWLLRAVDPDKAHTVEQVC